MCPFVSVSFCVSLSVLFSLLLRQVSFYIDSFSTWSVRVWFYVRFINTNFIIPSSGIDGLFQISERVLFCRLVQTAYFRSVNQ